jgi:hypothetical protein
MFMPTYYRPTERRGKRVVYRSTDPTEQRRETVKGVAVFLGMVLIVALFWFLSTKR